MMIVPFHVGFYFLTTLLTSCNSSYFQDPLIMSLPNNSKNLAITGDVDKIILSTQRINHSFFLKNNGSGFQIAQ